MTEDAGLPAVTVFFLLAELGVTDCFAAAALVAAAFGDDAGAGTAVDVFALVTAGDVAAAGFAALVAEARDSAGTGDDDPVEAERRPDFRAGVALSLALASGRCALAFFSPDATGAAAVTWSTAAAGSTAASRAVFGLRLPGTIFLFVSDAFATAAGGACGG